MNRVPQIAIIGPEDIRTDVYTGQGEDSCHIFHTKLGLSDRRPLPELRRGATELAWEAIGRVTLSISDATKLSPEIADLVRRLRLLDLVELGTWLGSESPDVVLMTIFEYSRRGLDVPRDLIYRNPKAMKDPTLRAYILEKLK